MTEKDNKSKALFFIFLALMGVATFLSYDRYMIDRDYPVVEEEAETENGAEGAAAEE